MQEQKFDLMATKLAATVDPHHHALVRNVFAEDDSED